MARLASAESMRKLRCQPMEEGWMVRGSRSGGNQFNVTFSALASYRLKGPDRHSISVTRSCSPLPK